jgi:hypothetical protein
MTVAVAGDFLLNSNAGTIGTGYVVRIRAETSGSGTISGNRYGLYIADQGVGTVSGTTYNFYSAGASRLNHIEGDLTWGGAAWVNWTPTWANLTLGNGTVVAKFKRLGRTVIARISLVFGSTTTIDASLPTFTLPVTAASYPNLQSTTPIGAGRFYDQSLDATFETLVVMSSTTIGRLQHLAVAGSNVTSAAPTATVPFTWAINDQMAAQFIYEAA